jgi:hypothetical protein
MSFPQGIRSDAIKVATFEADEPRVLSTLINEWLTKEPKGIYDIIPLSGKPAVMIIYRIIKQTD